MSIQQLIDHQNDLKTCQRCAAMQGPPVLGKAVHSKVLLLGQAPGAHEITLHKPFAWQAGKTLFSWFNRIGVNQETFRCKVYMAAMCRCYPGKSASGGDRLPSAREIKNCSVYLERELALLQPELLIPVGKLAISRFLKFNKLLDVIGQQFSQKINKQAISIIPLPHPSGVSSWPRTEPGKTLLQQALTLIAAHNTWRQTFVDSKV